MLVHDFPDDAVGKAIPYGVYDVGRNEGWVSVGVDHDTAALAVATIRSWWRVMGKPAYPDAHELYVVADAGGSNGYRIRLWKAELQKFADDTGLQLSVSHMPPGTSKWNKIEHRMFSRISQNWRGRPLVDHETVVNLIANTTTTSGLTREGQAGPAPLPHEGQGPQCHDGNNRDQATPFPRRVELQDRTAGSWVVMRSVISARALTVDQLALPPM